MYIQEKTLDDLLMKVFKELLIGPFNIKTSRSINYGNTSERIGNLLILDNPLSRLSRSETRGKPFSAIGELLWYFSKKNDLEFIEYYIKTYQKEAEIDINGNKIIHGGYGPRLFNMNGEIDQVQNIIKLLKTKSSSRKAVIQIFDAKDLIGNHKEIPCTCCLQFLVREGELSLFCTMRSNDAFYGLSHDIFCFTMIQEIIARELNLNLGKYYHSVASLHLYENHRLEVEKYIQVEGYQTTKLAMPEMPYTEPMASIMKVLELEFLIRRGNKIDYDSTPLDKYWLDFVRLLQVFKHRRDKKQLQDIKKAMYSDIFNLYIEKRINDLE